MTMDFNDPARHGDQVRNLFNSEKEFEGLLFMADECAETDWEIDFVSDIRERFEKYGDRTVISPAQLFKLREIAGEA